jgi:hypothetical protein
MAASSRSRWILVFALALGGGACTGADPSVAARGYAEGSVGLLDVERMGQGEERTTLSAAFARYRGIDADEVVGLIGSRAEVELEGCAYAPSEPAVANGGAVADSELFALEGAEVELLDVGAIHVRVEGAETRLVPRAFPDLASVLAGVFYAGDSTLLIPDGSTTEYAFAATGSEDVPAFEAVVPAPHDVLDLRVDGAGVEEPVTILRDAGAELTWIAGDLRDVVEIEIRSQGELLACAARDDGSFVIRGAALSTLRSDETSELLVRRVRVTPIDVPGLEDAFARIAVARALPSAVR